MSFHAWPANEREAEGDPIKVEFREFRFGGASGQSASAPYPRSSLGPRLGRLGRSKDMTPARCAAWARAAVAAVFSNRNPLPERQTLRASELPRESRRSLGKGCCHTDGPSQLTNDRTRAIRR